jgi:DNA polymerase-3 subunit delta'
MALKNIIGQDKALRILFGILKRDRVPSALLFSGDTGVGKRLTAFNLAKAVNCLDPVDFDCCDKCISCKKIDSGTHPDVTEVSPETDEIKIDAIRKIEETLSYRAFEGRRKVVIIDEADTMNINAANAFLKTLEEPPSESLILLVSSNPDSLPDTIRSRCTNIRFRLLPMDECRKLVAAGTGIKDAETLEMELVLGLAMGRPGLAVSRDFTAEKKWFLKLLNDMVGGESKSAWADKGEMKAWVDMSFVLLRDMAVQKITGKKSGLIYGGLYESRDIQAVTNAYQSLQKFKGLLDFNLNKSISWNYVASIMRQVVA